MALPIKSFMIILGFGKCLQGPPRELTVDHKQRDLVICQLLLNTRPYAAIKTIETIGQLGFEML